MDIEARSGRITCERWPSGPPPSSEVLRDALLLALERRSLVRGLSLHLGLTHPNAIGRLRYIRLLDRKEQRIREHVADWIADVTATFGVLRATLRSDVGQARADANARTAARRVRDRSGRFLATG